MHDCHLPNMVQVYLNRSLIYMLNNMHVWLLPHEQLMNHIALQSKL